MTVTEYHNFLSSDEHNVVITLLPNYPWQMTSPNYIEVTRHRNIWMKFLTNSPVEVLFKRKITELIGKDIVIRTSLCNGQSHGQCGIWHTDMPIADEPMYDQDTYFTIIYFYTPWLPEFGGHFLIKDPEVKSFIPEFNKLILFNSYKQHMGLEPTVWCPTQRENIAVQFRVIN